LGQKGDEKGKTLLVQVNLFQKLATSAEHAVYQNCSECQNKTKTTICVHNMFCRYSELTIFMNNLSSYCGLVDELDIPVHDYASLILLHTLLIDPTF
jgi:hypothetical protein